MITLEKGTNEYEIDLNKSEDFIYYVSVDSRDANGYNSPWAVIECSNYSIWYSEEGFGTLLLTFVLENIKKSEYLILANKSGDKARIIVKPNLEAIKPKKYEFRVSRYDITDDNDITLQVVSNCNGKRLPWSCTYDGRPYDYEIEKSDNEIRLSMKSIGDVTGMIELMQEKSSKTIIIELNHKKEGRMSVKSIR